MSNQAPSGMQSAAGSQGELADRSGSTGFTTNQVQAVQGSAQYGSPGDTGRADIQAGESSSPSR